MSGMQPDKPIDLGARAVEAPEESTRAELDAVGDAPDTGDVTPPDAAQHALDDDTPPEEPSAGLLNARLPFGVDRS